MFPLRGLSFTLSDGTAITLDESEVFTAQRYAPFAKGPLIAQLRGLMQRIHAPPIGVAKGGASGGGSGGRGGRGGSGGSGGGGRGVVGDVVYDGWEVSIGGGSMSSVELALQLLMDPGDILLVGYRHHAPLHAPTARPRITRRT